MSWQEVASGSKRKPRTTSGTMSDRPPTAISLDSPGPARGRFSSHCGCDLNLDEKRFQKRDVPDLMRGDERACVRYDRGHASSTAFSASHSSGVMSMCGMPRLEAWRM